MFIGQGSKVARGDEGSGAAVDGGMRQDEQRAVLAAFRCGCVSVRDGCVCGAGTMMAALGTFDRRGSLCP